MGQTLDPNTPYGSSRKSEALRDTYKQQLGEERPHTYYNSAPTTPAYYGSNAPTLAMERTLHTYMGCQYSQYTPATDGHEATVVPCTNPAVLMPGYQRACLAHVYHILRQSLVQYGQRTAAVNMSADDQTLLSDILQTLNMLCAEPTTLLQMATATKANKKVSKPRAKRTTQPTKQSTA